MTTGSTASTGRGFSADATLEVNQTLTQFNATTGDLDRGLMQRVYERFNQTIVAAVANTGLPGSFLAALTANESSGRLDAFFFEPKVYEHLKAVASGQSVAYGSIALKSLVSAFQQNFDAKDEKFQAWLMALHESEAVHTITQFEDADLRALSTSWGLTQIMGYHVVGRKIAVRELLNPDIHYRLATQILGDFAQRFGLKLSRDWEALFRCWNTGRPEGITFDPEYVSKALERMKLYGHISQSTCPR